MEFEAVIVDSGDLFLTFSHCNWEKTSKAFFVLLNTDIFMSCPVEAILTGDRE